MGRFMKWARTRRKPPRPRLKNGKYPMQISLREANAWRILDAQIALELWLRSNGMK